MLNLLRRNGRSTGRTGIHRTDDGWAVAQVNGLSAAGKPRLEYCAYQRDIDEEAFYALTRALPNSKSLTTSTLRPSQYNMLMVEAPDVAEEELRAAVRWRIKDLIDFSVDEAVIDVFQMPKQSRGGPSKMMYAIAARAEAVQVQVDRVSAAGLELQAIDILELSLRNIALRLDKEQRGVGLLYIGDQSGVLLLVKNNALYLARRIELGSKRLNDSPELRSELVAGLALEARRSLDYFESHYEQASIPVMYTAGLNPSDVDQIAKDLNISISNIDYESLFDSQIEISDYECCQCLPAIGAALREIPLSK